MSVNMIARQATLADKMSAFPAAQQVVGVGTFLSNLFKEIGDLGSLAVASYKKSRLPTLNAGDVMIRNPNEVLNHSESRPEDLAHNRAKHAELNEKIGLLKNNAIRHLKYMAIGAIRFVPIVATVYSSYVWANSKKYAPTIPERY